MTLKELARIPTTKKIVHGVAFSPDSRYAYVTQESIGADPGAVDVIDLTTLTKVSTDSGAGAADRHHHPEALSGSTMVHETLTTLAGSEVIRRAKLFFAQRMPQSAAFPNRKGRSTSRSAGRGARKSPSRSSRPTEAPRVRASTLFFDQAVGRFLSTLPEPAVVPA